MRKGVNQPRNLLEGKKADPHGREKPCKGNVLTQKRVQVLYKEIRVFKVKSRARLAHMPNTRTILLPGLTLFLPSVLPGVLPFPLAVSLFPSPASTLETAQLNTALPTSSPRYHGFGVGEKYQGHGSQKILWPMYGASSGKARNILPAQPGGIIIKNKYELNCMYRFVSFISGFYNCFLCLVSCYFIIFCRVLQKLLHQWRRCRPGGYHPPRSS